MKTVEEKQIEAQLKFIQTRIEQYNLQLSRDNQYIPCSIEFTKRLVNMLPNLNNKKILVINNLEILAELVLSKKINPKNIWFSTSHEQFRKGACNYGIPENQVLQLEYNLLVDLDATNKLSVDMEFDIIVANPPYKAGLHLRFLDKALDLKSETGEIVFIHPAEWLVQKRSTSRTKMFPQLKSKINGADIVFIDNPWEAVSLWVPLSITHINNSGDYYFTDKRLFNTQEKSKIDSLTSISILGDISKYLTLFNKLQRASVLDNFKKHEDRVDRPYYLTLFLFSGQKNDFERGGTFRQFDNLYNIKPSKLYSRTAITSPSRELVITDAPQIARPMFGKLVGNEKPWISFNTLEEAQNCHSFLTKSALFRSYFSVLKINQHAADSLLPEIPWLDWTQEWTDEKLFEHFELTQEEIQEVYRIIEIITVK
jgi:16S rRNA G966 N2-methylase RsmD